MVSHIANWNKDQEQDNGCRAAHGEMAELDALVGLKPVKDQVRSLVNLVRVRSIRRAQGLPVPNMSLHLAFTGDPGTGKTTVARLYAGILRAIGVLKKGHLIETDRGGLVAGYVGHTAIQTTAVVNSALDGVLFIDEAYALTGRQSDNDFGQEAVETLLKLMEDNRDRLVVIIAGYTDKISEFLGSNPGLTSRFARTIEFPNYSLDEMASIVQNMAAGSRIQFEPDALEVLMKITAKRVAEEGRRFGNARGMRNLYEAVIAEQANRLVLLSAPTINDLTKITLEDVLAAGGLNPQAVKLAHEQTKPAKAIAHHDQGNDAGMTRLQKGLAIQEESRRKELRDQKERQRKQEEYRRKCEKERKP